MKAKMLKSIAVAIALTSTVPAWAAWPDDKPIEVVVGFAAGGGTDLMARKLLPFVQKRLGANVQFVVQNKPGAAGEIANAYVARAKADGYTLAIVNVPGFLFLPMTKKAQYEATDFQLISRVVDDPTIVVTKSDNKINTFQAVLAALKQSPGALSFGHNAPTSLIAGRRVVGGGDEGLSRVNQNWIAGNLGASIRGVPQSVLGTDVVRLERTIDRRSGDVLSREIQIFNELTARQPWPTKSALRLCCSRCQPQDF